VQDITFRNNIVKSGGTGIQFLVHDDPNASSNMARGLFENNLFDDINSVTWGGLGNAWTFASYSPGSPEPNSAQEMVFNHNTVFPVTVLALGFVNVAAGDYHLAATSIYSNLATDGTDTGVSVDTLHARQACTISGVCSPAAAPAAPFGFTLSFSWQE